MSLKKEVLKLALENKELRPHLRVLLETSSVEKDGAVYLKEYVSGKDPEKGLKKLQNRDFKKLQQRAVAEVKTFAKEDLKETSQDQKPVGEVLKIRKKKIEALKVKALKALEKRFNLMLDAVDKDLKAWEKVRTEAQKESVKELAATLKEIQSSKPEEVAPKFKDYLEHAGNWAPKQFFQKVGDAPVSKVEAETLAWDLGKEGDKWSPTVLAVPVGEEGKLEGWYFFGWVAE